MLPDAETNRTVKMLRIVQVCSPYAQRCAATAEQRERLAARYDRALALLARHDRSVAARYGRALAAHPSPYRPEPDPAPGIRCQWCGRELQRSVYIGGRWIELHECPVCDEGIGGRAIYGVTNCRGEYQED